VIVHVKPQGSKAVVGHHREQVVQQVVIVPANQECRTDERKNPGVAISTRLAVWMMREPPKDKRQPEAADPRRKVPKQPNRFRVPHCRTNDQDRKVAEYHWFGGRSRFRAA
jgi:hypothetical protein